MKSFWFALAWLGLGLGLTAGCCGVGAPPPAKYFNRAWPESTLKGFVYSVETEQWDWMYDCLSKGSRDEHSLIAIRIALGVMDDPALDVSVFELVVGALDDYRIKSEDEAEGWAEMWVQSRVERDGEPPVYRSFSVFFVKEEDEWKIDFLETESRLTGR